jgi:phospholipase C
VIASGGTAGSSVGTCPSPAFDDPHAADRAACRFAAGATPADTLGISDEQLRSLPLKHIIVMMKENRSYDHYFAQLHSAGQPDSEALPASFSNPDLGNTAVTPFHQTTTCVHNDPGHQWAEMHNQINDGRMDGYVKSAANTTSTDGHFVMGWYDASDLPFYYFLANTYAIADRYFPSVRSGTWPNRDYLLLGTSDGPRSPHATPTVTPCSICSTLRVRHRRCRRTRHQQALAAVTELYSRLPCQLRSRVLSAQRLDELLELGDPERDVHTLAIHE